MPRGGLYTSPQLLTFWSDLIRWRKEIHFLPFIVAVKPLTAPLTFLWEEILQLLRSFDSLNIANSV
jgi:hypothetical protein